jgi:hypothetical protein
MSAWKAAKDGKQAHHILPKKTQKQTLGRVYEDTVVRVSSEDHRKMHRDIEEVGPIGSLAREDMRRAQRRGRKNKPF